MFVFSGHSHFNGQLFIATLKLLAYTIFAPLFLILILGAFVVALLDFGVFRLRASLTGDTEPKGLWEF